jgi:hypothetical protein
MADDTDQLTRRGCEMAVVMFSSHWESVLWLSTAESSLLMEQFIIASVLSDGSVKPSRIPLQIARICL